MEIKMGHILLFGGLIWLAFIWPPLILVLVVIIGLGMLGF
jgi:hypothetical protein